MVSEDMEIRKLPDIVSQVRETAHHSKKAAEQVEKLRRDLWEEYQTRDLRNFFRGIRGTAVAFLIVVLLFCNLAVSVRVLQRLEAAPEVPQATHVQGSFQHP